MLSNSIIKKTFAIVFAGLLLSFILLYSILYVLLPSFYRDYKTSSVNTTTEILKNASRNTSGLFSLLERSNFDVDNIFRGLNSLNDESKDLFL